MELTTGAGNILSAPSLPMVNRQETLNLLESLRETNEVAFANTYVGKSGNWPRDARERLCIENLHFSFGMLSQYFFTCPLQIVFVSISFGFVVFLLTRDPATAAALRAARSARRMRYSKYAGGSLSLTHRRDAMGGFTQDDG